MAISYLFGTRTVILLLTLSLLSCAESIPSPAKRNKDTSKNSESGRDTADSEGSDESVDADDLTSTSNPEPVVSPTPGLKLTEQAKISAFETTVFPLAKQYCGTGGGCHVSLVTPFISNPDVTKAYDSVISSSKMDLVDVPKSRLVLRLVDDKHNCWKDCAADGAEMIKAITDFKTKTEAGAPPVQEQIKQTAPLGFSAAVDGPGEPVDGQYIQYAKDSAAIVAPMVMASVATEVDGAVKDYLTSPTANAGTASYTFNVTQAGDYTLWVRAKFTGANQTLNVVVDGGASVAWQLENADPGNWIWDRANPTANNAATSLLLTALPVGPHTVVIRGGTANVRFNRVALTTILSNFQGGEIVGMAKILRFPAKELCGGKDVTLKVEVSDYDAKAKMMSIRNLRVETTQDVMIKRVEALINGKMNPLHSTFRVIDETVQPPGKLLVRSALIAIGEGGFSSDKLSFSFGKCE